MAWGKDVSIQFYFLYLYMVLKALQKKMRDEFKNEEFYFLLCILVVLFIVDKN